MNPDPSKAFTKAATQTRDCQTQIIATLGPATNTYETIKALWEAGADTFRLNFSHGTQEDHAKSVAIIKQIEKDTGAVLGILADMQGPKLRIGAFADDKKIPLKEGMEIRFDLDPTPGDEKRVAFPHPDIIAALEPGAQFLMDDGNVGMTVSQKGEGYIVAKVQYGTELSSRKGVNVPDLSRPVEALTAKDKSDLEFALSLGVDWIAQSFVQTADDVRQAKALIGGRAKLIAKIEKPAAIQNFDDILKEVDAIMVARGDLGVEMPVYKVPVLQKMMIKKGRKAGKPVVVATQMLDSMRESPRPTRAEVADVAQAVLDGASGVMLSGETSIGKYPVKAVEMMDTICYEMEHSKIHSITMEVKNTKRHLGAAFEPRAKKPAANDAVPEAKPAKKRFGPGA
jgi:pyruvate kinase